MITRKAFLQSLGFGALAVGVLSACGSSGGSAGPDAATSCAMNGTASTIGANHGHVLVVSKTDVAAGQDVTYHIMGGANHDHTVLITAAMFQTLQGNHGVMTTSSTDDQHSHPITVVCA